MVAAIDLNADLGEGVTDDPGLLAVVTSANVACGYHAGDADTMRRVCEEAARGGVAVGAQVSYDDKPNFGRVDVDVAYEVLRDQVADQVGVLSEIADAAGTRVTYVKPHGALYNRAVHDEEHARAVLDGSGALPVLGLPGYPVSALVIFELFAAPLVRALGGEEAASAGQFKKTTRAFLKTNVASQAGREDYIRVCLEEVEGKIYARPLPSKSGAIFTLVKADGMIRVDLNQEGIEQGEEVEVILF